MKRTFWRRWPFLLPSFLGTACLWAIPFFLVLAFALYNGVAPARMVWSNRAFILGAGNTALFLLCGMGLSLLLGLWAARALRVRSLAMQMWLVFPLLIPSVAVAAIWRSFFGAEGLFNRIVGGADNWLQEPVGMVILIALFVWKTFGVNTVLFSAAYRKIPHEMLESAKLDGAGGWHLFCHMEWPFLAGTAYFASLINLFFAWQSFREIYILTGDYPFDGVYFLQHYLLHMFHGLRYAPIAASSLLLTICVVIAAGLLFLLANRHEKDVGA